MKHLMRGVLAIVFLLLACGTSAPAAVLVTAFIDADPSQVAECWATNFGSKPAVVTIGLFDATGGGIPNGNLIADSCSPAPLGSGKSCLVATYGGVLCRAVVATTKVHVALQLRSTTGGAHVEAVIPAIKP